MESTEILNNDVAARVLPFIKNSDKYASIKDILLNSQNEDGGWGISEGYESDVLDTALVLNALVLDKNTEISVLQKAVSYIIDKQLPDGSWAFSDNEDSVISLTGQAAITLNEFQTKTNLTSSELQTAMRKAGEYLVSIQKEDKTWGTDVDTIVGTLLSYRAVLNTVGVDSVDTVDTSIINVQDADGSWYGSPYITALAIKAIKERMDMPYATIDAIRLYKDLDGTKTECYSYNAYETFEIQVDSIYNNADTQLLYFVKQNDGTVVSAYSEGQPSWNTANSIPGNYSVIVQVKDNVSGKILTSAEKQFTIVPSFKIGAIVMSTDPKNTRVDNIVEVSTEATLITEANINKLLELRLTIFDGATEIKNESKTISCQAGQPVNILKFDTFTPDVSTNKDYSIKVQAFDGENMISDGETVFKVLPPPAPTRIDVAQSLDKSVLYPGSDSVTAQFKLKGEGTPEGPQRTPIDLVLILDTSGSMSGTPWTKTKEAAQIIADMIQTEDRCAVVGFGSSARIQIDLTSDKELVKQSITNMPFRGGGTAMDLGIQKGFEVVANVGSDRQKIFMLLSDGVPNSQSAVYTKVSTAIEKEIKIYTLGLGDGVDGVFMQDIADKTGGTYKFSPTPQELNTMMTDLAGEIFDTAGKDIVLETTLPVNGMDVDTTKIVPAPQSVLNNADGSKTIKWSLDKLVMGQEKLFEVKYDGSNLVSDTTVLLTQNTKLTYQDRNDATVTVELPDLSIPVNRYMLDSKVMTDKSSYTANEEVTITNTAKNLTSYTSNLTGKVDITDINGKLVDTVIENVEGIWNSGESKTMDYTWNTGEIIAGTYKVRVTWSEGDKVISVSEASFDISADSAISCTVTVDKQKYTTDEDVYIRQIIRNNSTNNIESGLAVKTIITDVQQSVTGVVYNSIPELLPEGYKEFKNIWNTDKNAPGQYTVTMEVYRDDTGFATSSTTFEIVSDSEFEGITGVSGSLQVLQKNIYPADDVSFRYTINNTGNVNLTDVTARIRIVDAAAETVLGTITDTMNIDVSSDYKAEKAWTHEALKTGSYMVVLDALLSNGNTVPLGSGYFKVEKPFEVSVNKVVRPRVLVWAIDKSNIDIAKKTLDDMQVYYKIVSDRRTFTEEARKGIYTVYLMMDSKLPLLGHDNCFLAGEVQKGKGLIECRDVNALDIKNWKMFGLRFKGFTPYSNYTLCFPDGSTLYTGSLDGKGKVRKVESAGAEVLANINIADMNQHGQPHKNKECKIPAITLNGFGEGKAMLLTFDCSDIANTREFCGILGKCIEKAAPSDEISKQFDIQKYESQTDSVSEQVYKDDKDTEIEIDCDHDKDHDKDHGKDCCSHHKNQKLVELEVKITASSAVDGRVKELLPEGVEVLWVSQGTVSGKEITWDIKTEPGKEYILRYILKIPEEMKEVKITTESYYIADSMYMKFDSLETKVQ